jgi:hypothetical protein
VNYKLYFIFIIAILVSCKAPLVNNQIHHTSTKIPEFLSLGKQQLGVLEKPFQTIGVPKLEHKIKLEVKQLPYNATSYRAYKYYKNKNNKALQFALQDTLLPNPKYIQLSVFDRIGLANTLNANQNQTLRNYIIEDDKIKIVSSILFNANTKITEDLLDAEEVYALQDGVSNISIELIKDNRVVAILKLNDLEPFSYAVSNFCWGLDKRNKLVVKAINNENNCPTNTKAKAYKLETPYTYKF